MPGGGSETIRFSVENLLYYAPQIASVGTALAQAEATAQARLLGLGDFCGRSWPDHAFASSYPPSQYALLIMVKSLSVQISGIANGVGLMARNYGITEATLAADADRIAMGEARAAALLAHLGMPPPPDNPASLPSSASSAPVLRPDPEPQQPPTATPSSAPAPAPSHTAAAPPSPAASPTPDPEPQPPPTATSWEHGGGLHLTGPWPSGDPARMDEAAAYWTDLTLALESAWTDLQRYTMLIMSDSEGPAATAFSDYVDGLTGTGHGALSLAIAASQQMNNVCLNQAQAIRNLKHTIETLVIELVATFAVGEFVSLLTFETTQALTIALDENILGWLTRLVGVFVADSEAISATMETGIEAVAKVAAQGIAGGGQGLFIGGNALLASNAMAEAFGQNPVVGTAALKSLLLSGGLGAFGSGFTTSSGLLSNALIGMGEGDTAAAPLLLALGRQLKSGSITVAAANAALEELMTQGKLTPQQYLAAVAGARLGTAVAPSTGSHAAP